MSLFWYRRRIEKAAAGLLPAPELERLREHLKGCDACRQYYDRAVKLRLELGGDVARKERDAQLFESLLPVVDPPRERRRVPRWIPAFAAAVAAAILALVWQPWVRDAGGLRGGDDDAAAPLRVRVYTERSGGGAELLGELPGTHSVTAAAGARLQVSARGAGAVDVTFVGRTLRVEAAIDFATAPDAWTVDTPGELTAVDAAGHRVSCRVEVEK